MFIENDPFLTRQELENKAEQFLRAYNWMEHPVERMRAAFDLFDMDFLIETNPLHLPNTSGVYVFYDEDDIFYVGKSTNIKSRCTRHDKPITDRVAFGECKKHLISLREVQLIAVLRPLWNFESKEATGVYFYSEPTTGYDWSIE